MGQLKVFLSASKSANPINVQIIRDMLKKRGCLVFEYDPADPNEQMLGCDLLYIIPPEACDVIPRITVGRGQYEAIRRWEKEKSKETVVITNYLNKEFVFTRMEQITNRVCNRTRIGYVSTNLFGFDMNYNKMCKLAKFIDKPQAVHCANQQQWDFAASKLGRTDKIGYNDCGDIISIDSPNNSFFSTSTKANSYEILSFEAWCKLNDYSVSEPKWYETLKVGDKVKCIANRHGFYTRKIGDIFIIQKDYSDRNRIWYNLDSSEMFEEFELVSRLVDEKPVDPKIALLERAIKEYPIGTKFNSVASYSLTTGLHVKHTPKFNFAGNIGTKDNGENGIIYNAASGKWAEKIQENVTPIKDLPLEQWYKKDGFIVHLYHKNSVWGFHNGQWFESEAFSEEGLVKISEYDTLSLFKAEILKRYPSKVFTDLCNSLDFEIKNESISVNNKVTQIYIPVKPNLACANVSARIFDRGVWAKEVSVKPVEVTKSKFEVGKWYKYAAHTTNVWYIKYQKTDSNGIFIASEYIDNKRIYKNNLNNFTCGKADSKKVLLTDLSEIQQYLPEGHPDKIVTEKPNEFGYLVALVVGAGGVKYMKEGDIGKCISDNEFVFVVPGISHQIWAGSKGSTDFKWFKTLGEAEAFARTLDFDAAQECKHSVDCSKKLDLGLDKMYGVSGLYGNPFTILSKITKKKKLLKISTII